MKILFLVYEWSLAGGLERVTVDAARALRAAGALVDVWSLHDGGRPVVSGIEARGLRPRAPGLGLLRFPILAARIASVARRYDVVLAGHPHLLPAALRGIALGRARSRCWCWVYGLEVWGASGELLGPALARTDRVISISAYTAERIRRWVPDARVRIVPPGVDTDLFTPGDPSAVDHDEVLMVGRMSARERYKGHDVLVEALPHVERRLGRPIKLTITGGGDDRPHVEALARRSPAADRIRFAGRLGDPALLAAFRRCGVFAMPSRVEQRPGGRYTGEGFGIVYTEASACGRPVLASTDGGAPETVVGGVTGLLADPRRTEDVAEKLAAIMADPVRADAMGAAGRRHAVAELSLRRFYERVASLLAEG